MYECICSSNPDDDVLIVNCTTIAIVGSTICSKYEGETGYGQLEVTCSDSALQNMIYFMDMSKIGAARGFSKMRFINCNRKSNLNLVNIFFFGEFIQLPGLNDLEVVDGDFLPCNISVKNVHHFKIELRTVRKINFNELFICSINRTLINKIDEVKIIGPNRSEVEWNSPLEIYNAINILTSIGSGVRFILPDSNSPSFQSIRKEILSMNEFKANVYGCGCQYVWLPELIMKKLTQPRFQGTMQCKEFASLHDGRWNFQFDCTKDTCLKTYDLIMKCHKYRKAELAAKNSAFRRSAYVNDENKKSGEPFKSLTIAKLTANVISNMGNSSFSQKWILLVTLTIFLLVLIVVVFCLVNSTKQVPCVEETNKRRFSSYAQQSLCMARSKMNMKCASRNSSKCVRFNDNPQQISYSDQNSMQMGQPFNRPIYSDQQYSHEPPLSLSNQSCMGYNNQHQHEYLTNQGFMNHNHQSYDNSNYYSDTVRTNSPYGGNNGLWPIVYSSDISSSNYFTDDEYDQGKPKTYLYKQQTRNQYQANNCEKQYSVPISRQSPIQPPRQSPIPSQRSLAPTESGRSSPYIQRSNEWKIQHLNEQPQSATDISSVPEEFNRGHSNASNVDTYQKSSAKTDSRKENTSIQDQRETPQPPNSESTKKKKHKSEDNTEKVNSEIGGAHDSSTKSKKGKKDHEDNGSEKSHKKSHTNSDKNHKDKKHKDDHHKDHKDKKDEHRKDKKDEHHKDKKDDHKNKKDDHHKDKKDDHHHKDKKDDHHKDKKDDHHKDKKNKDDVKDKKHKDDHHKDDKKDKKKKDH